MVLGVSVGRLWSEFGLAFDAAGRLYANSYFRLLQDPETVMVEPVWT